MTTSETHFSTDQRQSLLRVVNTARDIIHNTASLSAPLKTLDTLALQLEAVAAQLADHSGSRAVDYYSAEFGNDINNILPYSPFSGRFNPVAPPVEFTRNGDKLIGEANFTGIYEGPPNCVHGGLIAGVYDQILAYAAALLGRAGPTAYLNIRYKVPSPLYRDLRFEAWVERTEGRKVFVQGSCYCDDQLLTEAEALFIAVDKQQNQF